MALRLVQLTAFQKPGAVPSSRLMRREPGLIHSSARTLALLEAVIYDGARSNVSDIARQIGMAVPTAHRQIATLVAAGYLVSTGRGLHVAGPRLRSLLQRVDEKQIITACAAPLLHELSVKVRSVVQLGTLENDMVTYRLKTGRGAGDLFTRTGMQLEAYCSGIGKVLLAHLPDAEREAYLANGPFVPLTPHTIVDGGALRTELETVRRQGFARDEGEIADDLFCLAVPIRSGAATPSAAISVARTKAEREQRSEDEILALLLDTAAEIATRLVPDSASQRI